MVPCGGVPVPFPAWWRMAKEILLRVLMPLQDINNGLIKGGPSAIQRPVTQGSLSSLFCGEECAQKMGGLDNHITNGMRRRRKR